MPRQRGAQPGNANALKHGFYSREFRNVEIQDLEVIECSLDNEIAGLRVAGRRMMELVNDMDDPMKAVSTLNMFGANCQRVARLLQVHATLSGGSSDVMSAISAALETNAGKAERSYLQALKDSAQAESESGQAPLWMDTWDRIY